MLQRERAPWLLPVVGATFLMAALVVVVPMTYGGAGWMQEHLIQGHLEHLGREAEVFARILSYHGNDLSRPISDKLQGEFRDLLHGTGQDRVLVFSRDGRLLLGADPVEGDESDTVEAAWAAVLQGEGADGPAETEFLGPRKRYMNAVRLVPGTDWVVLARQPVGVVEQELSAVRTWALAGGVAAVVLLPLAALLIGWRTVRPYKQVVQKAEGFNRVFDRVTGSAELHRLLSRAHADAARASDLVKVLQPVIDGVRGVLRVRYCAMTLLEPDGKALRAVAAAGERAAPMVGAVFQVEESGVTSHLLRTRDVLVLDDTRGDARYPERVRQAVGDGRLIAAPLLMGSQFLGALYLIDDTAPGGWDPWDLERVREVADDLALLVDRHRLHRDLAEWSRTLERRVAEQESRLRAVAQAERLATVGELVSGVAHELNNPLGVILGYAQLIESNPELCRDAAQDLKRIREAALRSKRIVGNLLLFARKHEPERGQVDPNDVVRRVVDLLAYEFRVRNVRVEDRLDPDLPLIWADSHQLDQVFLNLLANAYQALAEAGHGGVVTLESRANGNGVVVTVSDDGPGIPEDKLGRVFDPFFTTKGPGKGTGLGLATVYGIVQSHGGRVEVESPPGGGAIFRVYLPAGEAPESAPQAGAAPVLASGRPSRPLSVLVVEDEVPMAQVMERVLRARGHRAQVVTRAEDALILLAEEDATVDVLVTDLTMPGMGGMGLLDELSRRAHPLAQRCLAVTGDVASAVVQDFLRNHQVPVVEKPFDNAEFLAQVERRAADS